MNKVRAWGASRVQRAQMTEKPTGPSLGVQTGYLKIPGISAKAASYDFGVTCQTWIATKAGPDSRRTTQPGSRPACWCLLSRGPADPHDGVGWRSAAHVGRPGQEETPWANEAAARCVSPWDAAARESCPGTQLPAGSTGSSSGLLRFPLALASAGLPTLPQAPDRILFLVEMAVGLLQNLAVAPMNSDKQGL